MLHVRLGIGVMLAKGEDVWRVPLVLVAVFVAAFAATKRQTTPAWDCVLALDAPAPLNLEDPADRQLLADELRRVDAIAARFREQIRADPPVTTTLHAQLSHATRPDRAYRYCETMLREQVANAHSISVAALPPPID